MIVLFLLLAICALIGMKISRFHEDYCAKDQTDGIKGIFAVIIVFSHMNAYLSLHSAADLLYDRLLTLIGQLMVTMFLFYSGFGIAESWKRKPQYSRGFLGKRVLKVLVHFDLAVLLFAILNVLLGISYSAKDYLLCWIGWSAIGNSNWFVFDTLLLYLCSFLAMRICEKAKQGPFCLCVLVSVLSAGLWLFLYKFKGAQQSWWFNTVFCFPAGLWYSLAKERIDALAKKPLLWWLGLLGIGSCFALLYIKCRWNLVMYSFCTAVFCVLLVWLTMKVKLCNKTLCWLGVNSFSIYILQRIPMILLKHWGIHENPYLFAGLVIATVLPLSAGFTWLLGKIDRRLFTKANG